MVNFLSLEKILQKFLRSIKLSKIIWKIFLVKKNVRKMFSKFSEPEKYFRKIPELKKIVKIIVREFFN